MISLIVAMDKERCIGKGGSLPWHLRSDLKRVKKITTGNAIIMGRATFESIGKALPSRQNIVLTSDKSFSFPGVEVASSFEEALKFVEEGREAIVFGGASVYEAALPRVDKMYVTQVDAIVGGDRFFPEISIVDWDVEKVGSSAADSENDFACEFFIYKRK